MVSHRRHRFVLILQNNNYKVRLELCLLTVCYDNSFASHVLVVCSNLFLVTMPVKHLCFSGITIEHTNEKEIQATQRFGTRGTTSRALHTEKNRHIQCAV